MDSDGTAPRNPIADDLVAEIVQFGRSVFVTDLEMAVALLVGAYSLAAASIHSDVWAAALEKGAALARAQNNSKRIQ